MKEARAARCPLIVSKLDRFVCKLARYESKEGIRRIRARFPGFSRREKIMWLIFDSGTLFSPKPPGLLLDQKCT